MKESLENIFYVYFHYRQDDGKLFYIGKGKKNRYKSTTNRNKHWRNIVNKHGFYSKIVQDNLSESDAFELEEFCIAEYGIDKLSNCTLGGEGLSGMKHSKETKLKISQNSAKHNLGKKASDETKNKQSKSHKGQIAWNKGIKHNDETIEKMRSKQTGKKHTENQRKIMKEKLTGLKRTDEAKLNISNSLKGKLKSEEHKLAMKLAWIKRKENKK